MKIKKILKIILAVLGLAVLAFAIFVALNWESAEILIGTQNLRDEPVAIPDVVEPATPLQDTGQTDWISWRGGPANGRSAVTAIKKDFSAGLEPLWQVDYLCQGQASAAWTSPVIKGDRLIIGGRGEGHDLLFCLNCNNGDLLWKGQYAADATENHGTGMRATPAIDGDRVYTFGRNGDLVCWDLNTGTLLWHKNVHDQGGKQPKWGHSSSPLIAGDQVLVQGGGTARIVAYHKITGDLAFKAGKGDAGYAPIVPMTLGSAQAYLVFHDNGLAAIANETGAELWNIPWETAFGVNATTPLIIGDQILITSGYSTGAQLLKATETSAQILWTTKAMASHHSDAVILDGFLYGYSGQSIQNKGTFKCLELATGAEKWSTRQMGWGTCVYVDGHLLCLDIKGNLFLMKPDPKEFIKITEMPKALGDVKGPVWTLPVVANDNLYLRFKQRLVCYPLTD